MANHSSATVRETPHVNQTSRTNTIVNALKQRAQAVLNDKSIDPQSRAIIRYALEINDPWLARLVRRAGASHLARVRITAPAATAFQTLSRSVLCGKGPRYCRPVFASAG